jgi:hypothetical protein
MIAFLIPLVVFAQEPEDATFKLEALPERPARHEAVETDCSLVYPLPTGDALLCDALALPPAKVADYKVDIAWCEAVVKRYEADTGLLLTRQDRCEWRLETTTALLEEARAPIPLKDRPSTWLALGVLTGGAFAIATSYATTPH